MNITSPVVNNTTSKHPSKLSDHLFFYTIVSITGAAVMMLELLGTRIIGPFYGVSLFVWSSLISVTLLALAIGYYLGGLTADKKGAIRLSHIIFAAAICTAIIPMISSWVLSATDTLGLRPGAFCSALVLFMPCLILLGMTGPYVIKMATQRLENLGVVVGSIYAVSTIGSVIGTLLLGFYLLPLAGIRLIILVISLTLITLSAILALYESKYLEHSSRPFSWMIICVIVAAVLSAIHLSHDKRTVKDYRVLSDVESHYGWVRVIDHPYDRIRWLLSDSSVIGAESLDTGNGLLSYQHIVGLLPKFLQNPEKALLIGLGSGHLVKTLDRQGVKTDSIEIDPEIARVAKRYFSFKPSGQLIIGDARYEMSQLEKHYDIIIHDCFTGGSEPIHLLSREMLENAKSRLNDNGILALNMVGFLSGPDHIPMQAVARTLDSLFTYRRAFVSESNKKSNGLMDVIFMVSDQPIELQPNSMSNYQKQLLAKKEITVTTEDAFIITDNYNPMESLQIAKAEHYRDVLMKRLGSEILLR